MAKGQDDYLKAFKLVLERQKQGRYWEAEALAGLLLRNMGLTTILDNYAVDEAVEATIDGYDDNPPPNVLFG